MASISDDAVTILTTALNLARDRGWRRLTLADIAAQSGLPADRVYGEFRSKDGILEAFARHIDRQVLKEPVGMDGTVRDRIFDLMMRRFDALDPHRDAIRAILQDTVGDPFAALNGLCAVRRSMSLTLEAAGVSASGLFGQLKADALSALYLRMLYDWLRTADDETDDRIMAQLDRALTRAERIATSMAGQRDRMDARRKARRHARHETAGNADANAAGATEAPDQA